MDKQKRGFLVSWKPLRNFGLVAVNRSEAYFLHGSNIVKGPEELVPGMAVFFDIAPAVNGGRHQQAIKAVVVEHNSEAE
jgi:hypothetical protein